MCTIFKPQIKLGGTDKGFSLATGVTGSPQLKFTKLMVLRLYIRSESLPDSMLLHVSMLALADLIRRYAMSRNLLAIPHLSALLPYQPTPQGEDRPVISAFFADLAFLQPEPHSYSLFFLFYSAHTRSAILLGYVPLLYLARRSRASHSDEAM